MSGDNTLTVHAKKYDGRVRKTWSGAVTTVSDTLIVLIAKFEAAVQHNDLGFIDAGTVSFEHFWTDRWYNVFRFHRPGGELLAFYVNIAMPAQIETKTLSYIDLDVDVILWPDGKIEVLDWDDFEKNSKKFGYADDVRDKVQRSLDEVLGMIEAREFPFSAVQ